LTVTASWATVAVRSISVGRAEGSPASGRVTEIDQLFAGTALSEPCPSRGNLHVIGLLKKNAGDNE
jgi:hypothetical protein